MERDAKETLALHSPPNVPHTHTHTHTHTPALVMMLMLPRDGDVMMLARVRDVMMLPRVENSAGWQAGRPTPSFQSDLVMGPVKWLYIYS